MDNKRYTRLNGTIRMFLDQYDHKIVVLEEKFSKGMSPCAILMYPEGVSARFLVVKGLYEDSWARLDWENQASFDDLVPAAKYFSELLKSD